jgi:hypothetical protein
MNVAAMGRDAIVNECQRIIDEYPNDPRVAEAMLRAASVYELSLPGTENEPDPGTALNWLRRAAGMATPGSGAWLDANLRVANRLRSAGDASATAEAKAILEAVQSDVGDDPLNVARLTYELEAQALVERDVDAAERYCRDLLDAPLVDAPLGALPLDDLQASAARELMLGWVSLEESKEKRRSRINALAREYADIKNIEKSAAVAFKQLDLRRDAPFIAIDAPGTIADDRSQRRALFLSANVLVVLLLAALLVKQRLSRRKEST